MGAGVGSLITQQVWTVVVQFQKATPGGPVEPLKEDDPIYLALKKELVTVLGALTPPGEWSPTKSRSKPAFFVGGDVFVKGDLSLEEAHGLNCKLDRALQIARTARTMIKQGSMGMTIRSTGVAAVVTDNVTPAGQHLGPIDDCLEAPAVRARASKARPKAKAKSKPKAKR